MATSIRNEVSRLWEGIPVFDAKADLRVMIVPDDVGKATKKDPSCCVFAEACKRSFGSSKVLFYRQVAYVELPDSDGSIHVERFILPKEMRELVASFDRGEPVIPKAGFLLKAPPKYLSLQRLAAKSREGNERRRKLAGEMIGTAGRDGGLRRDPKPRILDFAVRSGTGAVHFVKNKQKKKLQEATDGHVEPGQS